MDERPSRLKLAQLVAGDLSPEEAAAVEAAAAESEEIGAQLTELRKNASRFEERGEVHRARLRAALSGQTPSSRSRRIWRWLIPLVPAAAAALLVLVLWPAGPRDEARVGFKGALAVRIVAKRGGEQFVVREGQRLKQGDGLRFQITTDASGFLSIFSIDKHGTLSPFYPGTDPARAPEPMALARAGRHTLPGSVILDDSRGEEHLVVVFARHGFNRSKIHQRIFRRLREMGPAGISAGAAGIKGEIALMSIVKE